MNKIFFFSLGLLLFGVYVHPMDTSEIAAEIASIHATLQVQFAQNLLLEGIKLGNVETMKQAIANGADINAMKQVKKNIFKTPLGISIDQCHTTGSLEPVQWLLNNGANPNLYGKNAATSDLMSTLDILSHPGNDWKPKYSLFKILYEYGADLGMGSSNWVTGYHRLIFETQQCMDHHDKLPKNRIKDGMLIGLLALNLLDEEKSRLDTAIEQSNWDSEKGKRLILQGKKQHLAYLSELDREIKADLEQKEDSYLTSCMEKSTKSRLKAFMGAQITGRLSLLSHEHNKVYYNGTTYLVSEKHF